VDGGEALRVRLDAARVSRESARGIGELAARRLDGACDGRERLIDRRRGIEIARHARELVAHGVFAFVQAVCRALRRVLELLGVTKARALVLELRFFTG